MSEFNFKSQVCTTREQSERLLALGLKKETADMDIYYSDLYGVDRVYVNDIFEEVPSFDIDDIPAWSLHRLWELANIKCIILGSQDEIAVLYDEVIMKIEQFIKDGCFNKEYLA